jgi:hypothetical protein
VPGDPTTKIVLAQFVEPALSLSYHCITRCVRPAFLLGGDHQDRKTRFEIRLQELAEIFRATPGATFITLTGFAASVPFS